MVPSLSQAPLGLSALEDMGDEPAIEIEIEDPEGVRIGMDGMVIDLMPGDVNEQDFDANLAEDMDAGELQKVASTLLRW
jgi:hypothetical protein